MKTIIFHGKRPRPEGQEPTNPSSKRQRTAEAVSVPAPGQTVLSAPHQEMMRLLRSNLDHNISNLDLSMFDPATVQSLPFSMASNLVSKVNWLTLPNGMQCLPLICKAMPALQALHAPDFNGTSLDLSSMHRLHSLTGSAGTALREIHLPLAASIDFRSEQKYYKIRVWLYQNGQAIQQHPLPSHTYFKTLPGRSGPDFSPINFKAQFAGTNDMIVCRDLSQYVLEKFLSPDFDPFSTNGYLGLSGAAMLPVKILPIHTARYKSILSSSKHYHFIDDASFANWVSGQFTQLDRVTNLCELNSPPMTIKKGFMAISSNHALVCMLAIKPGFVRQYAIVIHDPNDGLTHQRKIATKIEELTQRQWRFTDSLTNKGAVYFAPGKEPLLCLIEPEQRAANDLPIVHFAIESSSLLNKDLLALALDNNLSTGVEQIGLNLLHQFRNGSISAKGIFEVLSGRKEKNFPCYKALETASYFANPQMVTTMMAVLREFAFAVRKKAAETGSTSEGLPADFCMQLLKSAAGWDATPDELCRMNSLALEELCNKTLVLLDESLITGEQAAALLSPTNAKGLTCLGMATSSNYSDNLRILGTYLTALLNKGVVEFGHCLILLGQPTNQPTSTQTTIDSLVLTACKNGWGNTLQVYAELLINLADIYKATELSWLFLNDHITKQIMGPVSIGSEEAVRVMMWVTEGGEQLRTSLQPFLLRLTEARLLDQDNVLFHLCGSNTLPALPELTVAPQSGVDQNEFFFDDSLFDDGQLPF